MTEAATELILEDAIEAFVRQRLQVAADDPYVRRDTNLWPLLTV